MNLHKYEFNLAFSSLAALIQVEHAREAKVFPYAYTMPITAEQFTSMLHSIAPASVVQEINSYSDVVKILEMHFIEELVVKERPLKDINPIFLSYHKKARMDDKAGNRVIFFREDCDHHQLQYLEETGLIFGRTECPFRSRCPQGKVCQHQGIHHLVHYSCAVARSFMITDVEVKGGLPVVKHRHETFVCPECGSTHFGTSTREGISTGHCHGATSEGSCRFTWDRREDQLYFKWV